MQDSDEEYVAAQDSPVEVALSNSDDDFSDDDDHESIRVGMSKRTRSRAHRGKESSGGLKDLRKSMGAYSWEDEYKRPWDIVKDEDDEAGSLESIIQTMIESRKKKIMKHLSTPFQRGIIRTLIIIIDGSNTMLEKDLRPTRFAMMLSLLLDFVVEFFDQNPISQMGIVMMRNGVAQLVSEVSGLPHFHLERIRVLRQRQQNKYEPKGDPSLQNSLEMARSLLMYNFGNRANENKNSKEILIIFGALFTSDPGDIHKTIDNLVKEEIKVKIIGLSAQVAICQELVNKTNHLNLKGGLNLSNYGNYYGVILNESHFKELLMDCVEPLPIKEDTTKHDKGIPLIQMGFPLKILLASATSINAGGIATFPKLCACHPSEGNQESKQVNESFSTMGSRMTIGYECPQCHNRICHLPTVCPICGLMLILSTHLARSYHHLVPLSEFKEVPISDSYDSIYCFGCLLKFPEGVRRNESHTESKNFENLTSSRYRCQKCQQDFCIDCDVFVHETLHNCPGCTNKQGIDTN